MKQLRIPAVVMRGGTSKGVFFRGGFLPDDPAARDAILLRCLGSPDPFARQIDGMGGATSVTSKVVEVGPSAHPDCDVDYFFGQVDVRRPIVDYTGSCGNLSSAVGPFAIEEGLIEATDPVTVVRIWQVNTEKRIVAHIPTRDGLPEVEGDFMIDGVPFPGARIRLEYLDPGGSCTAGLLPTGRALEALDIPELGNIEVSLVDATNPVVFLRAADLGLRGDELAGAVDGNPDLLRKIELVRSHGSVRMGLAETPEEATRLRPGTPKIAFVAPPADYLTQRGQRIAGSAISLLARIMSMGRLHRSYALTGGIATAAAALVDGSVVNEVARLAPGSGEQELALGHPAGILSIGAKVSRQGEVWTCEKAVSFRTARRLMEGSICVPASVMEADRTAQPGA